ncbi:MAG: hypothetical protein IKQ60_08745 [Candidatus Methanomethylophilaceae archaeon]|nr:hypothetical protein [Candidatus Methanomethylophilaceae archaeon]
MTELISNEFTLYRKTMESTNRRDDVNVLVSMPVGLLEMLDPVLELGVFRSNQEFYKVSLFYLMDVYTEMEIRSIRYAASRGTLACARPSTRRSRTSGGSWKGMRDEGVVRHQAVRGYTYGTEGNPLFSA